MLFRKYLVSHRNESCFYESHFIQKFSDAIVYLFLEY